jgi:hypothetical protein
MANEKIWYDDLSGFITKDNYNTFFPSKDMTFAQQLNSVLRFSIYFTIFIFIIKKEVNVFFVIIFMAGFTYFLYTVDTKNKIREKFYLEGKNLQMDKRSKDICIKPTKDNPFMNVLMSDYSENPTRKPACNVSKGSTKKQAKKFFENNLYRDVSDIYDRNASDRNYYTTPITTIPNDQNAFANYLYGKDKTCKEANGDQCYKNVYRAIST